MSTSISASSVGTVEATKRSRGSVDLGRVAMVPFAALLGGLAVLRLSTPLTVDGASDSTASLAAAAVTSGLTAAFYALIIWCYLRRGPAGATTRAPLALLAGPVATFLPFVLPFTGAGRDPGALVVLGDLLLLSGLGFSVWSLRCLDRNLSVVPQARSLVQHGPYSRVRHPLYLGELVAMLGLALTLGGPMPLLLWSGLAGLQAFRAVQEEGLLAASLPEYAGYQARTARIVPNVF